MKKSISLGILSAIIIGCMLIFNIESNTVNRNKHNKFRPDPKPTQTLGHEHDEAEWEAAKDAYFELIHGGDEYDWRAINKAHFRDKMQRIADLKASRAVESYANGALAGEWFERGSNNQSGNVRITTFDEETGNLYAIGDGGILFKGHITGTPWVSLNDQFRLDPTVLEAIRLPGGDLRLLAAIGNGIWYSDDEGQTWEESTGFIGSTWDGTAIDLIQLNDADSTIVYLFTYMSVAQNQQNKLFYSKDHGNTFVGAHTFGTGSSSLTSMCSPHESSIAYILDQDDDVWVFEDMDVTQIADNMSLQGGSQCQIEVSTNGTDTVLYILMDQTHLYRSDDAGFTFNQLPDLPETSWEVGIGTSIDNVDAVYFGAVELYHSFNGGNSFSKISNWWEYNGDPVNKIHADIMHIQSFKTSGGTEFTLAPCHGGVFVTYDNFNTVLNLGLDGLNTGQFYDIATSPINASLMIGGTQDQGLQRSLQGSLTTTVDFEQVISGDYGSQHYSNSGNSFWTVYPFGGVSYYTNAEFDGGYTFWEDVPGNDLPVAGWIIPTCSSPNFADDWILVGGGNIQGGNGSYLIKMENQGGNNQYTQYNFDFEAASGSGIGAIETTPLDPDRWYVACENGKFYYSTDAGSNWTQTSNVGGPGTDWIYTSDVYASRLDPDLVFMGGTNYQGSPVWMSTNGGQSFTALDNGAPYTMVHELCMDPEENFLFAATDAGPYVYDMNQQEWFDLGGTTAPLQEYITCEFVEADNVVRFATWGRGIWDFKLADVTGVNEEIAEIGLNSVYPNPSNGFMTVNASDYSMMRVFNINGQEVAKTALIQGNNKLNLSFLKSGVYLIVVVDQYGKAWREKIVIN